MANRDITVRVDKRRLEALMRTHPERLEDALDEAALEGERIVKMSFNTSPGGKSYKRGGRFHIASQPDYPPNIDTGKLMNAIYVYTPKKGERGISTGDTEYAVFLEYGTTRMAARPFMRPMAEKLKKIIPIIFARVVE